MGGVIGCQVSTFFPTGAWLAHCCKKNRYFYTSLKDIPTADDEEHAHFFVCILGALREGNRSNYPRLTDGQSWLCSWTYSSPFIDTSGPEWRSKHCDGTLATVASI